ncbi:hypothetical protein FB451DRAFT_1396165 [Mycena latifolia]|nr:hypothetical protein FB451DRAFT_1396165 [Mycena latifolia]
MSSTDYLEPPSPEILDCIFRFPRSRVECFKRVVPHPTITLHVLEHWRRCAPPPNFDYFRRSASGATPVAPRTSFNNFFGVPPSGVASRSPTASYTRPARRLRASTIYFNVPRAGLHAQYHAQLSIIHHRVVNASHAPSFTLYASNDRAEHPCASAAQRRPVNFDYIFRRPASGIKLNLRVLDAASAPHASYECQRRCAPPPSFHYIFRHGATPAAPCTSFNNLFGVPASAVAASLTFAILDPIDALPPLHTHPTSAAPKISTLYFNVRSHRVFKLNLHVSHTHHGPCFRAHVSHEYSRAPAAQHRALDVSIGFSRVPRAGHAVQVSTKLYLSTMAIVLSSLCNSLPSDAPANLIPILGVPRASLVRSSGYPSPLRVFASIPAPTASPLPAATLPMHPDFFFDIWRPRELTPRHGAPPPQGCRLLHFVLRSDRRASDRRTKASEQYVVSVLPVIALTQSSHLDAGTVLTEKSLPVRPPPLLSSAP